MEITTFDRAKQLDASHSPFPSRLFCAENEKRSLHTAGSQFYGFVLEGRATVEREGLAPLTLSRHMFFSCPAPLSVRAEGRLVLWERLGYRGLCEAGGPVEESGRLRYIDGCTTTILAHPPKVLDPVLNLLVFPPHTRQTMHYHPTPRLGVIFAGSGRCVRPGQPDLPLKPGNVFVLEENVHHCFHTDEEPMRLIAFHPDSDTGPTDESHPMLNRTIRSPSYNPPS